VGGPAPSGSMVSRNVLFLLVALPALAVLLSLSWGAGAPCEPTDMAAAQRPASPLYDEWRKGREAERLYWKKYLQTGGSQWASYGDDMGSRNSPTKPYLFEDYVRRALNAEQTSANGTQRAVPLVKALDTGSGPVSKAGFNLVSMPGTRLELVATDPLAVVYDELMNELDIVPVVRTRMVMAEELERSFAQNHFDIATMTNAIDHTANPVEVVRQLMLVTKPARPVIIEGRTNEAVGEHYIGFHQWNMAYLDGRFVFWSRPSALLRQAFGAETQLDVEQMLARQGVYLSSVECNKEAEAAGKTGQVWIRCVLTKRAAVFGPA